LSVVRIRALRPAFLKSMTIPLSKEERASPETQRDSTSVPTPIADRTLLANSVRALSMDAVQAHAQSARAIAKRIKENEE